MKIAASAAAALLLAGAAHAQTAPLRTPPPAPPQAGSGVTIDLNSGPPVPAAYLAPPPVPETTVEPEPEPERAAPAAAAPTPMPIAPPADPDARRSAMPEPVAAPPAPGVTVLDSAARAALPFTADLPPGFELVAGRPGPDFRVYTIRRGDQSFVMIYAGPASQFPIYSGQMVEAGGRASVIAAEGGIRHALEHLFQRAEAPREIHVWTMSLDGADRAMAEQIAQGVDVR